jgi:hypothetical protein
MDGTPVRVERVLEDGRAIISWSREGGMSVSIGPPDDTRSLRNVAPKPQEGWISPDALFLTKGAAAAEMFGPLIYVREVMKGEE